MNKGIINEKTIINSLEGKYYYELNDNMKKFIYFIYPNIGLNDIIYSRKVNNLYKADIVIKINNVEKYISIKTGSENSVHVEKLDTFVKFLKEIKVNNNIINYLKLYHFGDDTYNGDGEKRYSAEESKLKYAKEILRFNKYVSYDNLLSKIIDRFLFIGNSNNKYEVDYIYYGNEKYAIWASREEILNFLINNKCYYMKTIHFSSLTFQNWCRNINKNKKSEKNRNYIQIKWFSIVSDLQKIRNKYDNELNN